MKTFLVVKAMSRILGNLLSVGRGGMPRYMNAESFLASNSLTSTVRISRTQSWDLGTRKCERKRVVELGTLVMDIKRVEFCVSH